MTREILLVMIPGAYFKSGDFAAHGFVSAVRRHGAAAEVLESGLPPAHYLDGDVAPWLHAHVIAPARGGRELWLLGISLGALGALLYAQAHPGKVAGMILLAPYVGSRGLVAEILDAGGLAAWDPGTMTPGNFERPLLAGLKAGLPQNLYLGYGQADRFAPASRLLAQCLPASHVVTRPGGHDWPVWEQLWDDILTKRPFDETEA